MSFGTFLICTVTRWPQSFHVYCNFDSLKGNRLPQSLLVKHSWAGVLLCSALCSWWLRCWLAWWRGRPRQDNLIRVITQWDGRGPPALSGAALNLYGKHKKPQLASHLRQAECKPFLLLSLACCFVTKILEGLPIVQIQSLHFS